MQSSNTELMKVIAKLKALPKKDRKAIERQLSGLDKIAVKKALKVRPLASATDIIEKEVELEVDDNSDDNVTLNTTIFSPWLNKRLSELLEIEGGNLSSMGVTHAVVNILPDCIEITNASLESFNAANAKSNTSSGFKSILAKLRGSET